MALYGKTDTQASQPKYLRVGQITGISISGTMSGYTSGSFTIGTPPGGGVQATATYVAVGGVITSYTITNPGAGYTTAPTITAAAGTGGVFSSSIKKSKVGQNVNTDIVFIDSDVEATKTANRAKGIRGPGWYKITEKMTSDGTVRYMTERLIPVRATVAQATDAKGDDLVVADVEISVTTQPVDSVAASGATTFTVVGSGVTTYQWQVQTGGTGAYTNLTNTGVYTTVTTATLNISNVAGLVGNKYRCVMGNGGTGQVTSRGAKQAV